MMVWGLGLGYTGSRIASLMRVLGLWLRVSGVAELDELGDLEG